jgi:hypothetical protein
VLDNSDHDRLVLLQDATLGWLLGLVAPIFLPCGVCIPSLKWTLDKRANTISRESRYCYQCRFHPDGSFPLSDYAKATAGYGGGNGDNDNREGAGGMDGDGGTVAVYLVGSRAEVKNVRVGHVFEVTPCCFHHFDEERTMGILNRFLSDSRSSSDSTSTTAMTPDDSGKANATPSARVLFTEDPSSIGSSSCDERSVGERSYDGTGWR